MEFNFPPNYPESFPVVKELDFKIPSTFHRNPDKNLCLCTPVEQYLIFSKEPTLNNFIINLLNPYLLSWLWYERYNKMPWGERKHGSMGIIESYQELLNLTSSKHTIRFMDNFIYNRFHFRLECPCGSGLAYRRCHEKTINNLEMILPKKQLINDFLCIMERLI